MSISEQTVATASAAGPVEIALATPQSRFSLRAPIESAGAFEGVLGLTLPLSIGARSRTGEREAMMLGPDEWVLLARPSDGPTLGAAMAGLYDAYPHSLADISDREQTLRLAGEAAETLLSVGCPRDLSKIAVETGRRTLFDDTQIVLWRDGAAHFRMDVWRSFAPHVLGLLRIANAELKAEAALSEEN